MQKTHTVYKTTVAFILLLIVIAFCVFRNFIFEKNEIFEETGTKIQLDCAGIKETKITKNIFEIRKIQNYIEKLDKEPYVELEGPKVYGWKIKGYIVVNGKVQHIRVRGNVLFIEDNAYKIADKSFQQKMVEYYNGIN